VQKFTKDQQLSRGLFDFAQICYRVWPRDIRSTTNVQGQEVKGQGHSVKTSSDRQIIDFFTALHAMQTRYSDENSVCLSVSLSVCPSVRLSVTRVNCDKTV